MSGFGSWLSSHLEELRDAVEGNTPTVTPSVVQGPTALGASLLTQRPDALQPNATPSAAQQYVQAVQQRLQQLRSDPLAPVKALVEPVVQQGKDLATLAAHPLAVDKQAQLAAARSALNVVGFINPFAEAPGPAAAIEGKAPFAIFTAENPGGIAATPAENAAHMAAARQYLELQGHTHYPTLGRYQDNVTGNVLSENGFLVPGLSDAEARALGKRFGQNGVITRSGYHDLTSGMLYPSRGVGLTNDIPYTDVGGKRYALDIDFENGIPHKAVPEAAQIAKQLHLREPMTRVSAVDPEQAQSMARTYESLPANDPAAQASYDALNATVAKQAKAIQDAGYRFEFVDKDPYKNSAEMMADVRDNKRLKVFKTPTGPGVQFHPYMTPEQNDLFRAVHDFLAHAGGGNEFGAVGEENAYRMHAPTMPLEALPALATETRGQNSWVNFGPNAHLPPAERPFAPQKAALFPSQYLGEYGDMPAGDATRYARAGQDLDVINSRLSQFANTPAAEMSDRDWLHSHLLQSEQGRLNAERVLTAPAAPPQLLPRAPGAGYYDVQLPNGSYKAIYANSPQEATQAGRVIRYQPDGWQPDPRNPGVEPPAPAARRGSTGVTMMSTIAGAGAGGLAGATQGNTPAERFRNAAIGALGGGALGALGAEAINSSTRGESSALRAGLGGVTGGDRTGMLGYHATTREFPNFKIMGGDLGVHFASTPEQAVERLQAKQVRARSKIIPAGRLLQADLDIPQPRLQLPDLGNWTSYDNVMQALHDAGYAPHGAHSMADIRRFLLQQDVPGIEYMNTGEIPGEQAAWRYFRSLSSAPASLREKDEASGSLFADGLSQDAADRYDRVVRLNQQPSYVVLDPNRISDVKPLPIPEGKIISRRLGSGRAGAIGDQPHLTPKMNALQDTPAQVEARVSDAMTKLRQPLRSESQGDLFADNKSILDRSLVRPDEGPTTAALPTRRAFGPGQAAGHVAELPSKLNQNLIVQQVVRGMNEGTPERFYPSFKAVEDAIAQHGGDPLAFRAATSAGSIQQGVQQEISNGTMMQYALKHGIISMDELNAAKTPADFSALQKRVVAGIKKDFPNHPPRGMLIGSHLRAFRQLLNDEPMGSYKVPTYFAQKGGDVPGFVLDTHESRGGTLASPFHRYFDDTGTYATQGEYGAQEQNYRELAHWLGLSDRSFQAARWAGGGNVTGLRTPATQDYAQIFEDMLRKNAARRGITPQQLLRDVALGRSPLFLR